MRLGTDQIQAIRHAAKKGGDIDLMVRPPQHSAASRHPGSNATPCGTGVLKAKKASSPRQSSVSSYQINLSLRAPTRNPCQRWMDAGSSPLPELHQPVIAPMGMNAAKKSMRLDPYQAETAGAYAKSSLHSGLPIEALAQAWHLVTSQIRSKISGR